ncbi:MULTISPECIES: UDP-galactopyranose mutase [unclassified Cyanobium]|uniref:UDP-galactopyranose mutase n=1 Tax=unclassified Cyanobium TaxID=2627006 RepID=UPI0020CEB6D8|nr:MULTISPECIES: UDP-galactopyranose mutase [unclassified Cyanobium]MCP9857615.1 UDP-galactopyranose mutase [Cyanobium sp. Cruz-8H5]MCP9864812.1 UDP-galactopyranose mutase [Cyanobium sp. Cruz-8D1]
MTTLDPGNAIPYDYLIVGCGLFGATFARLATDVGKRCLVIDRRPHIGGNCFTEKQEGINVHRYGAHIFHTSNKAVWAFVNRFAEFNNYINSPKAISNGKLYSLPFNMNTFYELWQTRTPAEARQKIEAQRFLGEPTNLEEQALSLVGKDIYQTLIRDYTRKQWDKDPRELPAFIIKRLPLRFTYDNNYFSDRYQGIPIGGYTALFEAMLEGIEVRLNVDFLEDRPRWTSLAQKVVYTGCIDQYFNYELGRLEYRSLDFENSIEELENFQGNAVINYCDTSQPFTRIIEHKHFEASTSPVTVITREYPKACSGEAIPYYPVNDPANQSLYRRYQELAHSADSVIFGGRLSEYKYMDMHVVIESAMNRFRSETRQPSA